MLLRTRAVAEGLSIARRDNGLVDCRQFGLKIGSQAARSMAGGTSAGAEVRRLRAPGLVVPGRTVHSSGEPPLRSVRLAGGEFRELFQAKLIGSHADGSSGHFASGVADAVEGDAAPGRSGRLHPLAFKVPGKPINRAGLAVAVSTLTVLSLYCWSKVASVRARSVA